MAVCWVKRGHLGPNVPQFHTHYFKLCTVIAQGLVAKCWAGRRDAVLKVVVKPQAIVTITVAWVSDLSHTDETKQTYPPPMLR